MRIFIICPVRNITSHQKIIIEGYVGTLEKAGHEVHLPFRDTPQDDSVGTNICSINRAEIVAADRVDVFWVGSKGSLFDLGVAWGLQKPIKLINDVRGTLDKSFENVILEWAGK